jgi:peroxiredoxin
MSLTPTTQIPLGFTAPNFSLPDTISGQTMSFDDVKGMKGTLVMFICNHCPFVIHVKDELVRVANDYKSKNIGFVAISSNDVSTHPQDGPEQMKKTAAEWHFPFPYLYDESQQVAKAYDAACTPDFALFDADNKCVYRGRLDDSRPGNGLDLDGKDMRHALDAILSGKDIPEPHYPSMGCNIKWKSA